MINHSDEAAEAIYPMLLNHNLQSESEACQFILRKLDISNIHDYSFAALQPSIPARVCVGILIYQPNFINNVSIHQMIIHLELINHAHLPLYNLNDHEPFSFDKTYCNHLLLHLGQFCLGGELLKLAATNRYWYDQIQIVTFVDKLQSFKIFKLNGAEQKYIHGISSQWHMNDTKIMVLDAYDEWIENCNFPKFTQTSIQYLDSNSFHFDQPLPLLRALQIWGCGERICYANRQKWKLQQQLDSPMIFTVVNDVNIDDHSFIPPSKQLLLHKCRLNYDTMEEYITSSDTMWIGIQQCDIVLPFGYGITATEEEINLVTPNKKLNIIYTGYFSSLELCLDNDSLYDKHVSHLRILFPHGFLDGYIDQFLSCVADVKNCNKPKEIVILFEYNGGLQHVTNEEKLEEFQRKDSFLFEWILGHLNYVQQNDNISKFVIGILRSDKEKNWVGGHTFDLKKIGNLGSEIDHYVIWNDIMYAANTDDSPATWQEECDQMTQSILTK